MQKFASVVADLTFVLDKEKQPQEVSDSNCRALAKRPKASKTDPAHDVVTAKQLVVIGSIDSE